MALPFAPIAIAALRYGSVALAAYYTARRLQPSHTSQASEDALDTIIEGVSAHSPRDGHQVNAAARWRRVVRWGDDGSGLEIDVAAMGRIRMRKI